MDNLEKVKKLKSKNDSNKIELVKVQERQKSLDEEMQSYKKELDTLKVNFESLKQKLESLDFEIQEECDLAEKDLVE